MSRIVPSGSALVPRDDPFSGSTQGSVSHGEIFHQAHPITESREWTADALRTAASQIEGLIHCWEDPAFQLAFAQLLRGDSAMRTRALFECISGLEALLLERADEVAFRLSAVIAEWIGSIRVEGRAHCFDTTKRLYGARSKYAHGQIANAPLTLQD